MSSSQPVRRRHLMDPDNPRPAARGGMSLTQVQKWVISVLVVTTILHLSAGLIVAAVFMDASRLDARIGLNVLGGIIAVVAVVAGRLIHRANPLTWWLLLGLLPAALGFWLTFR